MKQKASLFEFDNYNPMRCNIYEEAREKSHYPLGTDFQVFSIEFLTLCKSAD